MFTSAQTRRARLSTHLHRGADPGLTEREPWCIGFQADRRLLREEKCRRLDSVAWRLVHAENCNSLQQGVNMSVSDRSNPRANGLLRLYVAGDGPGARRALESRLRIMEELAGGIEIQVVDVLAHPEEAERAGILATPTLSDESTTPPRRLIGDISSIAQVLDYFGYRKKDSGYDHS